jgi:hypothetical protein
MIELIINNKKADILKEDAWSLNYSIADIREPDKRNSSYSKTIKLPGTTNNDNIFINMVSLDAIQNPITGYDQNKKQNAVLYSDGHILISGYVKLLSINKYNGYHEYEVALFNEVANIFASMGNDTLNMLPISASIPSNIFDKSVLGTSVYDSKGIYTIKEYNNRFLSGTSDFCFPFYDRGSAENFNRLFSQTQLVPAIRNTAIIKAIETKYGVQISSSLFNSDEFKSTCVTLKDSFSGSNATTINLPIDPDPTSWRTIPGNDPMGLVTPFTDWIDVNFGAPTAKRSSPLIKKNEDIIFNVSDYNRYNEANNNSVGTLDYYNTKMMYSSELVSVNGFKPKVPGIYTIDYTINFQVDFNTSDLVLGSNDPLIVEIKVYRYNNTDGNGKLELISTTDELVTIDSDMDGRYNYLVQYTAEVNDSITVKLPIGSNLESYSYIWAYKVINGVDIRTNQNTGEIYGNWVSRIKYKSKFEAKMHAANNNVYDVSIFNWDKIKVKDYFKSLLMMHNMYLENDTDNSVTRENRAIVKYKAEPYINFYDNKILDWNNKIDISSIKIVPMGELTAKSFVWKFKSDKNALTKQNDKESFNEYGLQELEVENEYNKTEVKNELIFSAAQMVDRNGGTFASVPNLTKNDEGFICMYDSKEVEGGGYEYSDSYKNHNITFFKVNGLQKYLVRLCEDRDNQYIWDCRSVEMLPLACNTIAKTEGVIPNKAVSLSELKQSYIFALSTYKKDGRLYYSVPTSTSTNPLYIKTLYDTYWKQYIQEISSLDSKVITVNVFLTSNDIANFKFTNYIQFQGINWKVNKIENYNPLTEGLCKVELIKVLNSVPTVYKPAPIVNIPPYLDPIEMVIGGIDEVRNISATDDEYILQGGINAVRELEAYGDIFIVSNN